MREKRTTLDREPVMDGSAWLARQHERIVQAAERKLAERTAPPEVIRRTVNGERVITRRHGNGR